MPTTHTLSKMLAYSDEQNTPSFIGQIDRQTILSALDTAHQQLKEMPDASSHEIEALITQLFGQWECLTISSSTDMRWYLVPIVLKENIEAYPFTTRLKRFIEGDERWTEKSRTVFKLQSAHTVGLPIRVETPLYDTISPYSAAITTLLNIVSVLGQVWKDGYTHIGIFEKPYGIINKNRWAAWLETDVGHITWQDPLHIGVCSMAHIIQTATVHHPSYTTKNTKKNLTRT